MPYEKFQVRITLQLLTGIEPSPSELIKQDKIVKLVIVLRSLQYSDAGEGEDCLD